MRARWKLAGDPLPRRVLMPCPQPCWLCEEYEQPSLPGPAIGMCCRPSERMHERHICGNCVREIYGEYDRELRADHEAGVEAVLSSAGWA